MNDTKLDDKICSMELSKIYLTTCFDGLEVLLTQREYFLKEAWEIIEKNREECYSGNQELYAVYSKLRDAYYKLKDRIKDEDL